MIRSFLALSFSCFCFLLASCVDVEETITLHEDGSATLKHVFGLGKEEWQEVKDSFKFQREDLEDTMNTFTQFYGEGVELQSIEQKERLGGKGAIVVTFQIADINTFSHYDYFELVSLLMMGAEETDKKELIKLGELSTGTKFLLEENTLEVTAAQRLVDKEVDQDELEDLIEEMDDIPTGFEITRILEVEGGFQKTDATHVKEDKITLLEFSLETLLKSNDVEEFFFSTDYDPMLDLTKLKALNEIEGILAEPKPSFTVER